MAPHDLRERFTGLIRREADHARAGRPSGIQAKMNQLQDPHMIRELYLAGQAVAPVCDPVVKAELDSILRVYEQDNCSAWDMWPDGEYVRRRPAAGEARRAAQQVFIEQCAEREAGGEPRARSG